jgi:hypothetical protein
MLTLLKRIVGWGVAAPATARDGALTRAAEISGLGYGLFTTADYQAVVADPLYGGHPGDDEVNALLAAHPRVVGLTPFAARRVRQQSPKTTTERGGPDNGLWRFLDAVDVAGVCEELVGAQARCEEYEGGTHEIHRLLRPGEDFYTWQRVYQDVERLMLECRASRTAAGVHNPPPQPRVVQVFARGHDAMPFSADGPLSPAVLRAQVGYYLGRHRRPPTRLRAAASALLGLAQAYDSPHGGRFEGCRAQADPTLPPGVWVLDQDPEREAVEAGVMMFPVAPCGVVSPAEIEAAVREYGEVYCSPPTRLRAHPAVAHGIVKQLPGATVEIGDPREMLDPEFRVHGVLVTADNVGRDRFYLDRGSGGCGGKKRG